MTAYVVFTRERTTDAAELERYAQLAPAAREGRDVSRLAFYGTHEVLEGPPIEGAVILRFPDMQAAREWYGSTAYQTALQHRLKGADYRVFVIEGIDPPAVPKVD